MSESGVVEVGSESDNMLSIPTEQYREQIGSIIDAAPQERRSELISFLELLPECTDFGFELGATILLEETNGNEIVYDDILDFLDDCLNNPKDIPIQPNTYVRFFGFHTTSIHYYKSQNVTEWCALHEDHAQHFSDWDGHPMYKFNRAMYLYYTEEAAQIRTARRVLDQLWDGPLDQNPGVMNAYVVCTLKIIDHQNLEATEEEVADARNAMQQAIDLYEFAGYYINLGRLQGRLGDYDEGIRNIKKGMDMEPPNNRNKLSQYRNYIININMKKQQSEVEDLVTELDEQVNRARESAQEVRSETLQFLGFFAAIITLIVTTVQVSTAAGTFAQTASLIPLLTGCIVLAFSVLRFLLMPEPFEDLKAISVVWIIGFLLLLMSVGIRFLSQDPIVILTLR